MAGLANRHKLGNQEAHIECPYCHSKKTGAEQLSHVSLIVSLMFTIAIITIPLAIIGYIMTIFLSIFEKSVKIKCDDCGKTFIVPIKEFRSHMKKIKHGEQVHISN